jgi:hypothetical protein
VGTLSNNKRPVYWPKNEEEAKMLLKKRREVANSPQAHRCLVWQLFCRRVLWIVLCVVTGLTTARYIENQIAGLVLLLVLNAILVMIYHPLIVTEGELEEAKTVVGKRFGVPFSYLQVQELLEQYPEIWGEGETPER